MGPSGCDAQLDVYRQAQTVSRWNRRVEASSGCSGIVRVTGVARCRLLQKLPCLNPWDPGTSSSSFTAVHLVCDTVFFIFLGSKRRHTEAIPPLGCWYRQPAMSGRCDHQGRQVHGRPASQPEFPNCGRYPPGGLSIYAINELMCYAAS